MNKELFVFTIVSLMNQSDLDVSRAMTLSAVYGSDINPNNNKHLVDALFKHLENSFSEEGMHRIDYFCFQQNFGRLNDTTPEMLWDELLSNTEVIDAIDLSKQKPYPYEK